jgi:hypothetical protein
VSDEPCEIVPDLFHGKDAIDEVVGGEICALVSRVVNIGIECGLRCHSIVCVEKTLSSRRDHRNGCEVAIVVVLVRWVGFGRPVIGKILLLYFELLCGFFGVLELGVLVVVVIRLPVAGV